MLLIFETPSFIGRVFSVVLCFGFCMLPMMYLSSYLFDIPSSRFSRMTLINVFTGVAGFLIIQVLQTPALDLEHVAKVLHWIFLLILHYSLSSGIRDVNVLYLTHSMCQAMLDSCIKFDLSDFPHLSPEECSECICQGQPRCCNTTSYYDWKAPGIGRNIFFSIMVGTGLIAILLLIEYRMFKRIFQKICMKKIQIPLLGMAMNDYDVRTEKAKIQNFTMKEIMRHNLVLYNLTKYYKNFMVVNNLCVAVKKYKYFRLLGVNKAGKTSTFKMCTGDISISSGNICVNGLNLKTDLKEIHQLIGYYPQFDALLDDLTCYETLIIFSLLRGLTRKESELIAKQLSYEYDFFKHLHKKMKKLSGGNKRKLSTAVAMIGESIILYLDESTTGMDPATKRYLWNALCKIRDRGTNIVITSHNMEECEALCTRLAIMVNGAFVCLASTQQLKNNYSQGYTLIIKVKKTYDMDSNLLNFSKTEAIENFIEKQFNDTKLLEQYQELLTFHIDNTSLPWSKMFGIMEKAKQSLNIEDYSLGQFSLEQVFLTFTKKQTDEQISLNSG